MIREASDGIMRFEAIKFNYEQLVIKEKIIKEESLLLDGLSFINYYDDFGTIVASVSYYTCEKINIFTYYTLEEFRHHGIMKELFLELERIILNYTNIRNIACLILPEYYTYFKDLDYIKVANENGMLLVEKVLIEEE